MTVKYFPEVVQGSDEWHSARCGLLTASQTDKIITPAKLQYSKSGGKWGHIHELMSQRITGYVEPNFVGFDMLRGKEDEIVARDLYSKTYAEVKEVGFVTNDRWGFTLGCSPDGLVGEDGQLEAKSKKHSLQMELLLSGAMPSEHVIQVQTAMIVTERQWTDFISYSAGLPMFTLRVYPDPVVQAAIIEAAQMFHGELDIEIKKYQERIADKSARLIPTERRKEEEIAVGTYE